MTWEKLIKRYKELTHNSSEKAPEGVWDNIARDLDRDLIALYQQKLKDNRKEAPEGIWEKLEAALNNDIESEYIAQVAQNQQNAPHGIWEGIEQVLDNKLIEQYKKQLAEQSEKAPGGLWQRLQHRLDIDEVWNRVETILHANDKQSFLWYYVSRAAAVAGIIITVGLAAWFSFDGMQQKQVTLIPDEDTGKQGQTELQLQQPTEEIQPHTGTLNLKLAAVPAPLPKPDPQIATTAADITPGVLTYFSFNYNPIAQLRATLEPGGAILKQGNPAKDRGMPWHEPSIPTPSEIETSKFASNQGFIDSQFIGFGFSAGIKNTWLFNNQTFMALAGLNGHRTSLSLIPDLALNLKYLAAPRVELQAGFSASTDVVQSYKQYIYGRFAQKDISLNYLHAELLVNLRGKHSWILGPHNITLSSSVGFYVAGLNYASESIMGEKTNVSDNYRNWDYGIILGQNVDFAITRNLTLSPGVRLSWGLPNIHKQMPELPKFMSKTLNRSLELRVAFIYKLQLNQH